MAKKAKDVKAPEVKAPQPITGAHIQSLIGNYSQLLAEANSRVVDLKVQVQIAGLRIAELEKKLKELEASK